MSMPTREREIKILTERDTVLVKYGVEAVKNIEAKCMAYDT